MRTALPKPFLAYYPALFPQKLLEEAIVILEPTDHGKVSESKTAAGNPPEFEPLETRASYDTLKPVELSSLGPTKSLRIGDIALARSGDKGSNLNCGVFVKDARLWDWLRSFLSREQIIGMLGSDWKPEYYLERVEFPNIQAVHFVIYGILGRGVSGSTRLDCLGKGFADYFRDKIVEVPISLLRESQV
jgi:hypothetical protein